MSDGWSVEGIISTAQAFDQKAARAREKESHPIVRAGKYEQHSAREIAFKARKFARYKVMNDE